MYEKLYCHCAKVVNFVISRDCRRSILRLTYLKATSSIKSINTSGMTVIKDMPSVLEPVTGGVALLGEAGGKDALLSQA